MNGNAALRATARVYRFAADIEEADRLRLAQGLARILAGSYLLCLKTQGFHWNVAGSLFYGLHKLTEGQCQDLAAGIDRLAARIRALGYPTPASFRRFGALSEIAEENEVRSADAMLHQLTADHETLARALRNLLEIADRGGDEATASLLTERLESHTQAAWLLRSLIPPAPLQGSAGRSRPRQI